MSEGNPLNDDVSTREVLRHFLKTRRARLRPEDVGLPRTRSRRTAGLRREEVAALAGVGDTWYGLFESGKGIHVSDRVIESVARALRLSDDEHRYLQTLVAGQVCSVIDFSNDLVDPAVTDTLNAIGSAPAFVIGPRLDYLAMNAAMRAIHRVPDEPADIYRNLMLRVFLDPDARTLYPTWDSAAERAVSKFRRNYGMHVGNDSFERLIEQLAAGSDAFRRLWDLHQVGTLHDSLTGQLGHPQIGLFHFRLQAFAVPDTHAQTLVVMLPLSAADEAAIRSIVAPDRTARDVLRV
jgi:hypothetical protein